MYRRIRSEKQLLKCVHPAAYKMVLGGHSVCYITYAWWSGRRVYKLLGSLSRWCTGGRNDQEANEGIQSEVDSWQPPKAERNSQIGFVPSEKERAEDLTSGNVKQFEVSGSWPPNRDVPKPAEVDEPQWDAERKPSRFAGCQGTSEDFLNGEDKLRRTDPCAQYCILPVAADHLAKVRQVTSI